VFKQLKYPGGSVGLVTGADVLDAEGLAFTFVSKAGALVSGMVGHGFVFRKARSWPSPEPEIPSSQQNDLDGNPQCWCVPTSARMTL
jgi:hypothetical protein